MNLKYLNAVRTQRVAGADKKIIREYFNGYDSNIFFKVGVFES